MTASPATSAAQPATAIAIAACAFALPPIPDSRIADMQLTPAGAFRASDGRPEGIPAWRIDEAIAARVIARWSRREIATVVDYEHQTHRTLDNGKPAPAAGWVRALSWRPGSGLWASVELTARASDLVAAGEYRYVSPVLVYDGASGEVLDILTVAITNTPAIHGMAPLELLAAARYAHTHHPEYERHDMSKLLTAVVAALSLDQSTTEDQAIAALSAARTRIGESAQLRAALGVTNDADTATAIAACTALRTQAQAPAAAPDPSRYVSVDVVEALKRDIAALSAQQTGREVAELVEAGLRDGRLLEAQRAWATDLGARDIAALRSYLESTPAIAALTSTQTGGQPPAGGGADGLTTDEVAVCTALGIDRQDYLASKQAIAAQ